MNKPLREIRLTNSMTGQREVLRPHEPGHVRMYSCGPTVYNFIHIGNLRAALTPDMMVRYFRRAGYKVTYVRNYTDVDDKIIDRANEEKTTCTAITERFIREVEMDYRVAGMIDPDHKTLATEHMPEMIAMTETLIAKGLAYVAADGEVLYAVEKFPGYGKLSGRNLEDLQAGARVEVDRKKRNPHDFALWKPAKPGEPAWPAPWVAGRPGWHIECSAMARKWLGDQIDVHHGGQDLMFPHHENEIAQTEGCTGKAPYVQIWVHNAFLNINNEKMSKSLGNFMTARDALTKFGGEFCRFALLSPHYRSMFDFGPELVEQAISGLQRIYEAKKKAKQIAETRTLAPDLRAESLWGEFMMDLDRARKEIDEAYATDFNTPGVLAVLFTLLREFNRICAEPRALSTGTSVIAALALIELIEQDVGGVFGVGRLDPEKGLAEVERVKALRAGAGEAGKITPDEIAAKIQARLDARKAKDFKAADTIRDELLAAGVLIKDGPQGTTWEWK